MVLSPRKLKIRVIAGNRKGQERRVSKDRALVEGPFSIREGLMMAGRAMIAEAYIDKKAPEGELVFGLSYDELVERVSRDIETIREAAEEQGFASASEFKRLGKDLKSDDGLRAEMAAVKLGMIASDFPVHREDAVKQAVRMLMEGPAVSAPYLFALGFSEKEIELTTGMEPEEKEKKLDWLLRCKGLVLGILG